MRLLKVFLISSISLVTIFIVVVVLGSIEINDVGYNSANVEVAKTDKKKLKNSIKIKGAEDSNNNEYNTFHSPEERKPDSNVRKENRHNKLDSNDYKLVKEIWKLHKTNKDVIGYITDNKKIKYPVLQAKNKDSNFYLSKDINMSYKVSGSIFIPNDIEFDDKMVLVYGHQMNDGSMFGSLHNYKNKKYFDSNKRINLYSLYDKSNLEVVAVLLTQVYYGANKGFEFYNYRGDISTTEFEEYKNGIKSSILYGSVDDISYTDDFVELITCEYSHKDGRLVLLCKRV